MESVLVGKNFLDNPELNKGTAFTLEEKKVLKIEGLVPDITETLELQVEKVLHQLKRKQSDYDSYLYLSDLLNNNETLFYKVVMSDPARFLPIIYTPTIGEACKHYDVMMRHPRGMYISLAHKGRVKEVLSNWPKKDVRFICVTNGGRVLGLGDLGANGMPIPIGKLQLYTAAAGVDPDVLMPLYLDLGTDNERLLQSPFYCGLKQKRVSAIDMIEFVEEFIEAAIELYPYCCIHFEDWGGTEAVLLLEKYRDHVCCFNDDIQGTASVVLAGLMNATKIVRQRISDQRILIVGAGSAAIGIADLMVTAMQEEGTSLEEARKKIAFFNTKGLVHKGRTDLKFFQKNYAHDFAPCDSLIKAIEYLKPTALLGVSTVSGMFTPEVLALMAQLNKRPIIFALSNPKTHAECTAEEAYTHTGGQAIFAAGVPFAPVSYQDKMLYPGQANNFYVFPALGLAVLATQAMRITDGMLIAAAKAVASQVSQKELEKGLLFPPQSNILESEITTAIALAQYIFANDLAFIQEPEDIEGFVRGHVYTPEYKHIL